MRAIVTILSASFMVIAASSTGCASSSKDVRDIGDVTVGAYTIHVATEGSGVTAGAVTQFVLKPTAGGKPTSITGWVGDMSGEGSEQKLASYDANDGDFDDDVTAPNPIPAGSKFWFKVETDGKIDIGSIAY